MSLEEMKKIAAARTPGKWWVSASDFEVENSHGTICDCKTVWVDYPEEHASINAEFISMAANNWDKLMAVVEIVKSDPMLYTQPAIEKALKALEQE